MLPGVVLAKYQQASISIRRKQMISNQNSGASFFAGLVVGGLVGASLALLLTPQSGEETRGQIRDKGVELKDGAVESLAEVGHRAQAQVTDWQETIETGKHNATEAISHSIDNITQAVTNRKDKVVEAVG
jgi:gas vesicle protein